MPLHGSRKEQCHEVWDRHPVRAVHVCGCVETVVVVATTVFVTVFFVIALTLPDVVVALTTPGPLEIATISGLNLANT